MRPLRNQRPTMVEKACLLVSARRLAAATATGFRLRLCD
jgi:hypothetical protein